MKIPIAALLMSLLGSLVCVQAAPPAGRYSGVLKLTKHVDGLTATATVRAVATVGASGGLTIVLATAQSPLPDVTGPGTTPSDVLRTTINADNSCIIPGKATPKSGTTPSAQTSEGTVSAELPDPIFRGVVRTSGSNFGLAYTDIPTNYNYLVAPMNFTEFNYSFRRVSPVTSATPN